MYEGVWGSVVSIILSPLREFHTHFANSADKSGTRKETVNTKSTEQTQSTRRGNRKYLCELSESFVDSVVKPLSLLY